MLTEFLPVEPPFFTGGVCVTLFESGGANFTPSFTVFNRSAIFTSGPFISRFGGGGATAAAGGWGLGRFVMDGL